MPESRVKSKAQCRTRSKQSLVGAATNAKAGDITIFKQGNDTTLEMLKPHNLLKMVVMTLHVNATQAVLHIIRGVFPYCSAVSRR